MQCTAVFLLVLTFAAPVVDLNTATFPITHRVPMNRFVWAQDLAGPDARVPPEFGNIVEARENSSRNAVSLRIARSQQQKPPSGLQILDQRPAAFLAHQGASERPPRRADPPPHRRGKGVTLGYRDHTLVDNQCGIILATVATSADYDDADLLPVLLNQAEKYIEVRPREAVADSQYGSQKNQDCMARRHIDSYLKRRAHSVADKDKSWMQLLDV